MEGGACDGTIAYERIDCPEKIETRQDTIDR